ncbi:MAG: hypothetical protein ABIK09_11665 [Pseudomonadota bacterium]
MMLVFAFAGAGCLESNPQPSPGGGGLGDDTTGGGVSKRSPQVDEDLLLVSAMGDDGAVVLVGMNGCAADADYAEAVPGAEDPGGDGDATSGEGGFAIDDNGGFGGVVPTVVGTDEIIVTFHFGPDFDPPVVVVPVPIPVLPAEDDGRTPWFANADSEYDPDQGSGAPPEEVWDGFAGEKGLGGVEIEVDGDVAVVTGLAWTTTPFAIVAVLNQQSSLQASVDADTTGGFVVEIPASSGDTLLLYAVNPLDKEKATAPAAVVVP